MDLSGLLASMRPQQFAEEDKSFEGLKDTSLLASMRPQQFAEEDEGRPHHYLKHGTRFNEASAVR